MHKIGVISDTHGLLRPEVVNVLRDCEVILHGGDFATEDILDELNQIAPVYAVRGNNDFWAYAGKKTCIPLWDKIPLFTGNFGGKSVWD